MADIERTLRAMAEAEMRRRGVLDSDTLFRPRRLDGSITPFDEGDIRTTIPNVYKGPLETHEPRLPSPAKRWRT